jgi:tetratricopeptide (TPR) repeat protein
MKSLPDTNWAFRDDEDSTLLDVECYTYYESQSCPGTVTLEGFGLECWDAIEPQTISVPVSYVPLPTLPISKLLRRVDELRRGDIELGQDSQKDLWDLLEVLGDEGYELSMPNHHACACLPTQRESQSLITYRIRPYTARRAPEITLNMPDLYEQLNRRDIMADFGQISSVTMQTYATEGYSLADFIYQMILSKELARRLERYHHVRAYAGFTEKILASLIIADRWFQNTRFVLEDIKEDFLTVHRPETEEERARAEELKVRGNRAMDGKEYEKAAELYEQVIEIDGTNAVYRCNLSAALASLGKHWPSQEQAVNATALDPGYAKAWARLGFAEFQLGRTLRAKDAYTRAIEVAGPSATATMKQGLVDAQTKIDATLKAVEDERDRERQDTLRKAHLEEKWDVVGMDLHVRSIVHERQAEGLLVFAEKMKWPYIDEVRDCLETVYKNVEAGLAIDFFLHDWLTGVILPGRWFAFTIMSALIMCSPSITDLGVAQYYNSGLSLPDSSYWRVRTVLGRVLASLPGVVSLNGWIGPCPPVQVVGRANDDDSRPRHVKLKAQGVLPSEYITVIEADNLYLERRPEAPPRRPHEEEESYIAEIEDPYYWVSPEPPAEQATICEIKAIRLEALPLNPDITINVASRELDTAAADKETEYLASIEFQIGGSPGAVTYTLHTNPVFVSLESCYPEPNTAHQVHVRELPEYQTNVWTVEQLKSFIPGNDSSDMIIINATDKGARTLAQAWCAERGQNAVVRTVGGPCFACALRAAGKLGLGIGALIWVS